MEYQSVETTLKQIEIEMLNNMIFNLIKTEMKEN
jgi:hypothetical protein